MSTIYNKVILNGNTVMDISDTTATASDVPGGKYFYTAGGVKTEGTGSGGSATLGTKTITANGTYDPEDDSLDGYSEVTVNVPDPADYTSASTALGISKPMTSGIQALTTYANGITGESDTTLSDAVYSLGSGYGSGGSSKNIQVYSGYDETNETSYVATDVSITIAKSGTYKISWTGVRNTTGGTSGSQAYVNGTAKGSTHTTGWIRSYYQYVEETLTLNKDDVVTIYGRARASNYYMVVGNLIAVEQ